MKTLVYYSAVLICLLFATGCSTYYENSHNSARKMAHKTLKKHISAAKTGGYKDAILLAEDYCNGVKGWGYDGIKNYKELVIFSNKPQCRKWVNESLLRYDSSKLEKKGSFWDMFYLMSDYTYRADGGIEQGITIIKQRDERILYELLFAVIGETTPHQVNPKKLLKDTADHLCRKYSLNKYCGYLGHQAFIKRDYQSASDYYFMHNKNHVYHMFAFNFVQLCLDHPSLIPNGASCPKNLVKNVEQHLKSMHKWCVKKDDYKYLGLTYTDCRKYKTHKADETFLLKKIEVKEEFINDKKQSLTNIERKYKIAVTESLKNKSYRLALIYYDFLDQLNVKLSTAMIFYRAESYNALSEHRKAVKLYQKYLDLEGMKGIYSKKASAKLYKL